MDKYEHFYEALYQIWKRGGNPDLLSFDKAEKDYYAGREPYYTAKMELKRQRELNWYEKEDEDTFL